MARHTDVWDDLYALSDEEIAEVEAEEERRTRGEELKEEAARLTGDLRAYVASAWHILEPATTFKPNWHLDAIAEALEAVTRGEIRRLAINIPPRHMKSLSVSVFWPTWRWAAAPHVRFLTASYGEKLATRDAVKSRRLITSAWYRARFGHVFNLTTDQNTKTRYENDRTGYRIATSPGGQGTGEGGDVIVIDDPHKTEEIESDTERQNVIDWHDGTLSTRFNDPETGIEVLVMQRLHEEDLTGHVLGLGGWEHLCLPAEYEPRHPFVWPDDPRTAPGELLWPDHFGTEAVAELKTVLGSYRSAGQLQQRPAPSEGGIFKTAHWRYFDPALLEAPSELVLDRIVQSWDTAWKDKQTSDYVVGAVWGITGANRYLLRRTRERLDLPGAKRALRELYEWAEATYPHRPHTILVPRTDIGPDVIAELRDEIPGIIGVGSSKQGDKVQRAHAITPQLESGNIFLPGHALPDRSGPDPARTPGWVMEWIDEHASFPHAAHDDQVDTTTQVLLWLRGVKAEPKPDPSEAEARRRPEREAVTAGVLDREF